MSHGRGTAAGRGGLCPGPVPGFVPVPHRTETLRLCFLLYLLWDDDKRAIADLAPWRLTKTQRFEVLSPSTALEARRGCSMTPTRAPRLHPSSVRAGAARAAEPEPGENPVSLARG